MRDGEGSDVLPAGKWYGRQRTGLRGCFHISKVAVPESVDSTDELAFHWTLLLLLLLKY